MRVRLAEREGLLQRGPQTLRIEGPRGREKREVGEVLHARVRPIKLVNATRNQTVGLGSCSGARDPCKPSPRKA